MKKPPKVRCAIYTRKSHEEGLDQEFNSLDAQRVAGEAYVQSHSKQTVRTLLSNYLYLGKIKDKEQIHDGDHQAIIDADLWNRVQAQIQENSVLRRGTKNKSHAILFKGKLTDNSGNPFVTTYTKRGSKRYYYYLNKTSKLRIGVAELNTIITNVTASLDVGRINLGIEKLSKAEISKRYPAAIDAIVQQAITKVILHEEKITLMIDKQKLAQSISDAKDGGGNTHPTTLTHIEILEHSESIEVTLNVVFRRYAGRKIGCSSTQGALNITTSNHDNALIRAIVRCHKWNIMLETQKAVSIKEIAEKESVEHTYAGDVMRLKYLSPETASKKSRSGWLMHNYHLTF